MKKESGKSKTAEREEEILKFWQENKIFDKSLEKKAPEGEFVFYDGPPFATGEPHYGHLLAGTIKDAIPRYKTMRGNYVRRVWGWDCHGLPVENLVEKELNLGNKREIEKYGIDKFNAVARASVLKYEEVWKNFVPRSGRWVDMDNAYKTMDSNYTESVWWAFKTLFDKNLIYDGFKVMPYCPHCGTTLSNFEVNLGYKDISDISVYVKFKLKAFPNAYFLAWTTTPWTLPGNTALAVGKDIEYVEAKVGEEIFVLAKERLPVLNSEYEILATHKGSEMVGMEYHPVFDFYAEDENIKNKENGWKVYAADFVTIEEGTGIVHIAPAFGSDDYELSVKENLPFVQHVDMEGRMKPEVKGFEGMSVKPKSDDEKERIATDIEIIKYLQNTGAYFDKKKISHSYPHCWRCDTPLLNYATSSWFVKVTDLKERMTEENEKIKWVPKEIGENRFGKWLLGARDWAISRSRFWGAPLPVWVNEKGERIVIGSIEELKKMSGGKLPSNEKGELDLHRPYIDDIELVDEKGGKLTRVKEVFDTWFDSGSMPYASVHYPFENKEAFDKKENQFFPADFIAEGLDQTRGWFYTLLVLGVGLFDKSPYKNVIVNGIVLDETGSQKLSKKLKNYPDPYEVFDKYGADSVRYYLLSSPLMKSEDLAFSEKGVDEVHKKIILRLENVLSFYEMYADKGFPMSDIGKDENVLDKWLISRLNETGEEMTKSLDNYELDRASRPILNFIDDFSTWYIRRSRERFKSDDPEDKNAALSTTRFVLLELAKYMAPFTPFFAEHLYQKLKSDSDPESVHLCNWPKIYKNNVDTRIIAYMEETRRIVSLGLEKRNAANIKVRQPLQTFKIVTEEKLGGEYLDLIKDEVNVREVIIGDSLELNTIITSELKKEGEVREFIRAVQDLRKEKNLTPNQKITLQVETLEEGKAFVEEGKTEISKPTNIAEIKFEKNDGKEVEIGNWKFRISL